MQVTAAEFKAKCLKLMDEIAQTREPIIITKRGKPIARLMPVEEPPHGMFGYMRGTFEIVGDIVETPEVEWNALKDADSEEDQALFGPVRSDEAKP
jgi:prevent-host-death family protein